MATRKTTKKRPGKGGPRPGSGRPPIHEGGTVKLSVRLPMDLVEWFKSSGLSQSEAIVQAVRASPAFVKWQAEQRRINK